MIRVITLVISIALTASVATAEHSKYYSPTFTSNILLYILDPDSIAGWCLPLREYEKAFMDKKYSSLPMLGGWRDGGIPDREVLLKLGINKAFVISDDSSYTTERAAELRRLKMDVYTLKANSLNDYIPLMRNLGNELGVPERGEELAKYAENALEITENMTSDIPQGKKMRVYWALGPDGSSTACTGAIELAGGINVHSCKTDSERINFEQLMLYDPDVIITINPSSAPRIMNDPKWQRLRAFRAGRIYVVPYGPFGWMHMPEVTRFMGIQWLACTLYPDRCLIDIDEEAKKFTKLYMHIDITDAQLDQIMHRGKKW